MSALADISKSDEIPPELKALVEQVVGKLFWGWYEQHKDVTVVKVGWWFIHKSVHVSDLRSVFEMLFGPEPTVV